MYYKSGNCIYKRITDMDENNGCYIIETFDKYNIIYASEESILSFEHVEEPEDIRYCRWQFENGNLTHGQSIRYALIDPLGAI